MLRDGGGRLCVLCCVCVCIALLLPRVNNKIVSVSICIFKMQGGGEEMGCCKGRVGG